MEFPKDQEIETASVSFPPETVPTNVVGIDVQKKRAEKYHIALGPDSPGTKEILLDITNDEGRFRETKAVEYDNRFNMERENVISQYLAKRDPSIPFGEKDLEALRSMTKNDLADPATFLEKRFAKSVADWEQSRPGIFTNIQDVVGVSEQVSKVQSQTVNLIAHKEAARKLLEEYEGRIKEQGWGDWLGSHVSEIMPIVPWFYTQNAFSKQDELLKGGNIAAQVKDFYSKDLSEGLSKLREAAETVSNRKDSSGIGYENLVAARNYIKAFVEYSFTEAFADSALGVVDVALTNTALKTTQAMARGLAASVSHDVPNMATRAMALGKQAEAVDITAIEMIKAKSGSAKDADNLFKSFPSLFNNKFYDSAMHSIPTEAARLRAQEMVESSNEVAIKALIANPSKITRIEGEAEALARADTVGTFQARYPDASDAVLDVVLVPNVDQVTNINTLEIVLGNVNKKLFTTETHADRYAREVYGLASYEVKQQQTSPHFYISTKVDVAENATGLYRNVTVPLNRAGAAVESAVGWLKGANRNFDKDVNAARTQVPYLTDVITKNVQDLAEPIKAVRNDTQFSDFWLDAHIKEKTYTTASDMEQAWLQLHGRLPTEAQVKAYDASIRINELARLLENMLARSYLARVGVESHTVRLQHKGQIEPFEFLGRFRKDGLPVPTTNSYTVGVVDANGAITVERATTEMRETLQNMIDTGGYRAVQLVPEAKTALAAREVGHVDYIVVKDMKTGPLPFQVTKRKQGFNRVVDPETYVVSQPNVNTVTSRGVRESYYNGDNTLLHARDARTARELAENVEIGRRLMLASDDVQLQAHLGRTMPGHLQDVDSFRKLFRDGGYNPNIPFISRQIKDSSFGRLANMKTDDGVQSLFPNLQDAKRNEHNIYNEIPDIGYTKDSENIGHGVTREGSDANPTYVMTRDQVLSPLASLERSVEELARSAVLEDYKLKAGRDFVEKYQSILNTPIEDLRRDPYAAVVDPKWTSNADPVLKAQAINAARAHKNLMGVDSPLMTNLKTKFYSTYAEATGSRSVTIDRLFSRVADTNPVNAMRQFTFHTTQGLFAVPTMIAQAMNVTHILAIHPKNGLQGASASLIRSAGRVFGDESTYKWADSVLKLEGWKQGEYKEAIEAYYRSGFNKVSANTMTDAAISPIMRQGKIGDAIENILDAGTLPLRAGEAINRDTAWFTAYKAWKDSNPGRRFDGRAEAAVLLHADTLAGQMSRASKAAWDTGVLSVATQYKSWYARQIDILTGNSLTTPQKLRLLTASTALHGIAAGGVVGIVGGAFWPTGQSMSKYLNENGINTDDAKVKAITRGAIGAATESLLGSQYAFTERFGPGQNDMFKLLWNGEYIKALSGPTGSLLVKAWESQEITEGLKLARGVLTGEPNDPGVFKEELLNLARTVRSVNDVYNLHTGLAYGKMFSRGTGVVDVSTQETLTKFFTGMNSQVLQDTYDRADSLKDRKKHKESVERQVFADMTNMFKHRDNPELSNRYQARAIIRMEEAGFSNTEKVQMLSRFNQDTITSTNLRFKKEFPASTPLVDKVLTSRGN